MTAQGGERQATPENTFVIGLAMAGAVSAGAYTAGVLDTLFRALAEHERRFQAHEVGHRVVLKAMSGASAGSICAALGAAGLVQGVTPHDPEDPARPGLPLLHDLWVERLRLGGGASGGLLGTDDLEAGEARPVASILDASHLDAEARALVADVLRGTDGAGPGFVAGDLDIFLTTTNLMGVTYEVRFGSGEGSDDGTGHGHVMASHGNVEHFRLTGLGTAPCRSAWLRRWADAGIALEAPKPGERIAFGDLFGDPAPSPWARLVRAALASAAFPVGLASRRLDVDYTALESRAWPIDTDPHDRRPRPVLPEGIAHPVARIGYVAVDGGVANNEPFELARYAIRAVDPASDAWRLAPNPRDAKTADRAVLMIDPFPEGPEMALASTDPEGRDREASLLYTLRRLLPSLIDQARFKPTELLNATDTAIHSRFLVAPSRTTPGGVKLRGAMAIASGFLGGFGGFFDRRFRAHDYRLGQHNCRSFLRKYFVLDGANPVFDGRSDLLTGAAPGTVRILQVGDGTLPDFVDAAGVFDPRGEAGGGDRWPGLSLDALDAATESTGARLGKVATLLMREVGITGRFKRWVAKYLWKGVPYFSGGVRDALSVDLSNRIKGEMVARDQLLASRHFANPRDRALYAAIVRNGNRRATPAQLADLSEIHVPTPDAPMNTLTLDAADVEKRVAAGIVRLWRYRGRWGLIE